MKVVIGSDHAGYKLKEDIACYLREKGIQYTDFGTDSSKSVDYPDIGLQVSEAVARGEFDCGILVCGSGIGMSITANKVPGIRAALCGDSYCARLSREHNDANILVLGDRITGIGKALDIVEVWLNTEFPGEPRHVKRVEKIAQIESKYSKNLPHS